MQRSHTPKRFQIMSEIEKDMIEKEEGMVLNEQSVSPAESAASEGPVFVNISQETPTQAAPEENVPVYGVPQPLFEDFIPSDFSLNDVKAKKEEKAEKTAAPILPEQEQIVPQVAVQEEEAQKAAPAISKKDKKKAAKAAPQVAPVVAYTEEPVSQEMPEAAPVKQKVDKRAAKEEKALRAYKNKLRKKYKLNQDELLSENDVIRGFVLAKGEHLVRAYSCLNRGDGSVCLTNKRLLISAGERSELEVDKVTGIKFTKYTHFSVMKLLFGLLFLGLGVFMILLPFVKSSMNIPFITGKYWKHWFFYVFLGCGAASALISLPLLLTMIRRTFYFYIYAKQDTPFFEVKSRYYAKNEKKGRVYKYVVSKAGKDSEKAARELGALLLEVKDGRYDY